MVNSSHRNLKNAFDNRNECTFSLNNRKSLHFYKVTRDHIERSSSLCSFFVQTKQSLED